MNASRWFLVALLAGCGGASHGRGASARPPGCEIEVVHEGVPSRPTRESSQIVERCRGEARNDDARCLRLLEDQACHMGAQVMWDVRSQPVDDGETLEMHAEAAIYR